VRLDTSEALVDRSLWEELGDFKPTGVNERLVRNVRDALDDDGFEHVKIVVSGGFTIDKIKEFEEGGSPSTPTASARHSFAARTISRPTSS
jgi:nicotinate phosphoribosyltransferase